jgi:hypothetical protein
LFRRIKDYLIIFLITVFPLSVTPLMI